MEIEFFCHPAESMKWYEYWRDLRKNWYSTLGIKSANLLPREQGQDELAFYSIGTTDIEYLFPFSDDPQELEGVAHRGAYDLTQHATHSGLGDKLGYFDQDAWAADAPTRSTNSFEQWLKTSPTADADGEIQVHPARHRAECRGGPLHASGAVRGIHRGQRAGRERARPQVRTVMKFHPRLAPIKAAIFPLVNKEGMPDRAMKLYRELEAALQRRVRRQGFAPGKRYRRQDECRHAVLRNDRRRHAGRRHGHHPGPGHHAPAAGAGDVAEIDGR